MARIIAIDDEQAILDVIERILKRDGHDVLCLADPTSALKLNLARADLILCDVMMPGIDGFELVRELRPRFDGPIIFLTAKVAEEDAVTGYGIGADDYVRKPFGAAELRAKVAAHVRRERREHTHAIAFGPVRLDLGARQVTVDGAPVTLTPTEYEICEALFGWEREVDDAAISMHVSRARKKLAAAGADPIATVWGMGYKWQL